MYPNYGQPQQQAMPMLDNIPSTYFVPGVPQRLPFPIQIPVSPQMQADAPFVIGFVIDTIQRFCNYDPSWKMLFWTLYGNGQAGPYNTQEFWTAANTALELAETMVYLDRIPVQRAAPDSAAIVLGALAAQCAMTQPAIWQMLSAEQQHSASGAATAFNNIKPRVAHYIQTRSNGMNMQGGYGGYQGAGVPGVRVGGGFPPQQPQGYGGGYPMNNFQQPVPQAVPPVNTPFRGPVPASDPNSMTLSSATTLKPQSAIRVDEPVVTRSHVVEEVTMDNSAQEQTATGVMEPTNKSKLKLSFSATRGAYHAVYNPHTHTSMMTDEDGVVVEKIVSLEEIGVNYDEHETEQYFRSRNLTKEDTLRKDIARSKKAFEEVVNQKSLDIRLGEHKTLNGLSTEGELTFTGPSLIDKPIVVQRGCEPMLSLEQYLCTSTEMTDPGEDAVISFQFIEMDPFMSTGEEAVKVAQLANSQNYTILRERLLELRDYMSRARWNRLNEAITDGVNEYLTCNMGLKTTIESFVDDILKLADYLIKKHRSTRIGEVVNASVKHIAVTCCATFSDKDSEFRNHFSVEDDEADTLRVASATLSYITSLPITSADVGLKYEGGVGLILDNDETGWLFGAVDAIFKRIAEGKYKFRHVYFVTQDGVKLYVYKAAFGDGYLLRAV